MRCSVSRLAVFFSLIVLLGSFCSKKTVNPMALEQERACVQNLQLGDYERAQVRCKICLEYDESVSECLNGLGLVAFAKGDDDNAISYFSKSVRNNKNFAQGRNNLGAVYFKQGNFSRALPYFQEAIQIDPGYTDARYNLGLCYLRLGQQDTNVGKDESALTQYHLAEPQYLALVELRPNYGNAYRDLGLIWTYRSALEKMEANQKEDLQKANGYFQQCVQVDPNNEGCRESYGHTLLYQAKYNEAVEQFQACLSANKNNGVCTEGLNAAYQGAKLGTAALQQYAALVAQNPTNPQMHYDYCTLLFQNKLDELAVSECKQSIDLHPPVCLAYHRLAMYNVKTLNSNMALTYCRSFLLCATDPSLSSEVAQCQQVITQLAPGNTAGSFTGVQNNSAK